MQVGSQAHPHYRRAPRALRTSIGDMEDIKSALVMALVILALLIPMWLHDRAGALASERAVEVEVAARAEAAERIRTTEHAEYARLGIDC